MSSDAVDLRRMWRCCEGLISNEKQRGKLNSYIGYLEGLISNLERRHFDEGANVGISAAELEEYKKRIALLRKELHSYEVAETKLKLQLHHSSKVEQFNIIEQQPQNQTETLEKPPPKFVAVIPKVSEETKSKPKFMTEEEKRKSLFDKQPSFQEFMNRGEEAISQQLEHMEKEQDQMKEDIGSMVSILKQRATAVNGRIVTDLSKLDQVSSKADENLSRLSAMQNRLEDTFSTTAMSCKMCAFIASIVISLWIVTYIVMRLFPKVKSS